LFHQAFAALLVLLAQQPSSNQAENNCWASQAGYFMLGLASNQAPTNQAATKQQPSKPSQATQAWLLTLLE
jgi:hypothetical protein